MGTIERSYHHPITDKFMKRFIIISLSLIAILLCACEKHRGDANGTAKITFSSSNADTKAFINQINRSGNELVVFDYVTDLNHKDKDGYSYSEFYIRHKRIHCTVDDQAVWDYVESDEYYWLYGTDHKCFGWLYSGPSGYDTISFFGEHPHLEIDTDASNHVLHLPEYEFTLNSPIYDFMYSDIVTRKYTQNNPDSSPVNLTMNHLFSAFRFSITNMQLNPITVNSVTLKVYTQKQTSIDFKSIENGVQVSYKHTGIDEQTPMNHAGKFTLNTGDLKYLFTKSDEYKYHMVWAQTEEEFKDAELVINYTRPDANGNLVTKDEILQLNKYNYTEWKSGQQYTYNIVFTEKEILLECSVEKWDRVSRPLEFSDVVVVSDKLQWNQNTIEAENEHEGYVVIDNNKEAECYFEIDSPGEIWTATFLKLDGNDNAFKFVNPNPTGNDDRYVYTVQGSVGAPATLKIVPTSKQTNQTNRAIIRIAVKVNDRTIIVENLCTGHDYNEYTIVQNQNI